MTIDELLTAAAEQVRYSLNAASDGFATVYALRAQAAALTAQAMILNERSTLTIERIGEYAIATVGMVGKLEVQNG